MTPEPAAVPEDARIREVLGDLRELWQANVNLPDSAFNAIVAAWQKDVATYAAAQRQADNELQKAVLAERYQEGREDGIGWAQRANDDIIADLRAQLAISEGERDRWRDDWRTTNDALVVAQQIGDTFWEALKPLKLTHINVANPGQHVADLIADLTASEAAREQARVREQAFRDKLAYEGYHEPPRGDEKWCPKCVPALATLTPGAAAPNAG